MDKDKKVYVMPKNRSSDFDFSLDHWFFVVKDSVLYVFKKKK